MNPSAIESPDTADEGEDNNAQLSVATGTTPERLLETAAALFRGLVKNHGLGDGNKRLAVTTMSTFLLANGWVPRYTNSQLYLYALRVAAYPGNYPVAWIERWVRRNCRLMSDAELEFLREQNRGYWRADPELLTLAFDPDAAVPERD